MKPQIPAETGEKHQDIESLLRDIVQEERALNDTKYAPRMHLHPEFQRLEKSVESKMRQMEPPDLSQYALANHSHPQHRVPLDYIERGNEISALLDTDLCPREHSHPQVSEALATLQAAINALAGAFKTVALRSDYENVLASLNEAKESLLAQLRQMSANIPVLPVDEPEIAAGKFCIIPKRCAGRPLASVIGVTLEGVRVPVELTFQERRIKLGDVFSEGDVLTLPPKCLVLLRFK